MTKSLEKLIAEKILKNVLNFPYYWSSSALQIKTQKVEIFSMGFHFLFNFSAFPLFAPSLFPPSSQQAR